MGVEVVDRQRERERQGEEINTRRGGRTRIAEVLRYLRSPFSSLTPLSVNSIASTLDEIQLLSPILDYTSRYAAPRHARLEP